jgi:hypothetical protein
MEHLEDFLSVFNDRYPFERYIFNTPCSLDNLFDDVLVTEVFVPSTEIKPYFSDDGQYLDSTEVPVDEIYLKLKGPGGEFRMGLIDFDKPIYENVIFRLYEDFGDYAWECLYMDYDEEDTYDELQEVLLEQKRMITNKYGVCNIKEHVDKTVKSLIA